MISFPALPWAGHLRRLAACAALFAAVSAPLRVWGADSDWLVRNWQVEDGLPDNTVTGIQQTGDGYLWVGTYHGGLARFDGVQFKTFDAINTPELGNSRILSLMAGPADTLWIGTEDGGLLKMSGGHFENVPLGEFGSSATIPALFRGGDGALWISVAGKGVACLKAGVTRTFTESNKPAGGKLPDAGGDPAVQAWLSARHNLLTLHEELWAMGSGQNASLPDGELIAVQRSRDGSAWTASRTKLKKLAGQSGEAAKTTYHLGRELASSQATMVAEDHEGALWVGTTFTGLYCAPRPGEFVRVKSEGPLSDKVVSAIFEDRTGLIWVGTYGGGLFRIKHKMVTNLTPPELGESVMHTCCAAKDGSVWMGSGGSGVWHYVDGKFSRFGRDEGLTGLHVCAVFEDNRTNLWVGTLDDGLFRLEGSRFVKVSCPAGFPQSFLAIYEDRSSALWLGCLGGVARKRGDEWTLFTVQDGLSGADVRGLAEDANGGLWIATAGGGLDRLKDGRFTHFGDETGFSYKILMSLLADSEGTVWIGTQGNGLVRFKDGKFTTYDTRDGLGDNLISGIIEDASGNLWLGSQKGVLCVSKRALNPYQRGVSLPLTCLRLGTSDGMASLSCSASSQNSVARTADGRLWIPNWHAVAVVDPRLARAGTATTSVLVEEALIDGRDYPLSDSSPLQVQFGRNRFEFHYTALDLPAPETARFRHKLEGLDADWVDDGGHRQAYYGQLPPGRYRFRVMAAGANGDWCEAGSSPVLDVVPHFWELRWVQIVFSILLVGVLAGLILLNQRRKHHRRLERLEMQRALETERGRIARDIHDELGSSLTQIALMSEMGKDDVNNAVSHFDQVAGMARSAVGSLDEIVWAVNPKNDNLPRMVSYLSRFAFQSFASSSIRCRQEVPADLPGRIVRAEVRHNLFLAVKEALHNVLKHSRATECWLRVRLENRILHISIEDNGRGFDPARSDYGRDGLGNMSSRLAAAGGRMCLESSPGQGTRVHFELAFPPSAGGHDENVS